MKSRITGAARALIGAAALGAALFPFACAAQSSAGSPALWRVADADSELYLFGTFHLLPSRLQWETSAFDSAMRETETTIVEADVSSPEAQAAMLGLVQRYGLNPKGVTLSSTLGPKRAAELKRVAANLNVPMATLEPLRPWLALVTLAGVAMQVEGFDPSHGVETVVLARAGEEGDALAYFETAEEQVKILADLDDGEMLANFDITIEEFDDFKATTERILEAWRVGDVETLDAEILAPLRDASPKAFHALIVARNENWAKKIADLMSGEGDYFIAVGAGHLIGDDSVIDLLTEQGFTVERVQ
ncbi:MAG: TraB/GumN family protein [Pseudomonadota bacterium]|nr:TraB/GumN family protein [Pseudomonadota bacterium]